VKTKTNLLGAGIFLAALVNGFGQPVITKQPTNQSVSLGASASFQVSATTSNPPLLYQWRLASANLATASTSSLVLTNIQLANAGDYDVVVADSSGSSTSEVARLEVDPTFTKITSGPVVTDAGSWAGCAWGDYDNDGFLDLFITDTARADTSLLQRNALYHNNQNGTFSRVTTGAIVSEAGDWRACAWADYDNDGHLDLIVSNDAGSGFPDQTVLYRNKGDGTFTKMPTSIRGPKVAGGAAEGCAWADYDNDGFVDLYIARYATDWLLHNNGDGTLTRITNNVGIPSDTQDTYAAMWGDYDNDGWPDLCVGNQPILLYHNNGNATFTKILTGSLVTEGAGGCIWVDYDNDGSLDAFTSDGQGSALYHNNGDGTFTKKTSLEVGSIAGGVVDWVGTTWGDYDNDGFVDLFLTTPNNVNSLYHSNGDGTFTRVLSGSLVNDFGNSYGCSWGDYDNDGFLDLVVIRGAHTQSTNLLYHNNGNNNRWIKFRLVGTVSNRSAIGAKVRVKAVIGGLTYWQMREISAGGDSDLAGGLLEAHFGLGDATHIDLVRIEWPSGIVQTMTNVPPRQFLTVVEHQENAAGTITFTGTERSTNGAMKLSMSGDPGFLFVLEASTNLAAWTKLGVRTTVTGAVMFLDATATNLSRRFYRLSAP